MPKKAFSTKQKKAQLQAKNARKRTFLYACAEFFFFFCNILKLNIYIIATMMFILSDNIILFLACQYNFRWGRS